MSTVTMDQVASVIGKAASDPAFRAELLSSPASTLGLSGFSVKVVENTENARYLVLPSRPSGLSDADLQAAVAESLPSPKSVEDKIASYAQLVAKSWTDSALRSQLLSNPAGTLAAHGISVPSGVSVKAVVASEADVVLSVPPAAAATSASETTVGDMASTITSSFTNLTKLITAGSYLAGLGFSIGAIMKFKQHNDNPTQVPIGTPIALVFIAAALLFLPTILSAAGETRFGE